MEMQQKKLPLREAFQRLFAGLEEGNSNGAGAGVGAHYAAHHADGEALVSHQGAALQILLQTFVTQAGVAQAGRTVEVHTAGIQDFLVQLEAALFAAPCFADEVYLTAVQADDGLNGEKAVLCR